MHSLTLLCSASPGVERRSDCYCYAICKSVSSSFFLVGSLTLPFRLGCLPFSLELLPDRFLPGSNSLLQGAHICCNTTVSKGIIICQTCLMFGVYPTIQNLLTYKQIVCESTKIFDHNLTTQIHCVSHLPKVLEVFSQNYAPASRKTCALIIKLTNLSLFALWSCSRLQRFLQSFCSLNFYDAN